MGSKNSLSNTSPGCMFSSTFILVVVYNLNIARAPILPVEDYSPLKIYSNTVVAFELSSKRL